MLHSPVYNHVLTPELKEAYYKRDADALWIIIRDNATALVELQPTDLLHSAISARLQLALAMRDSLVAGGSTCSFTMDYINL